MSLRSSRSLPATFCVAIISILCHSAFAADRIHYTVTLGNPETHLVQVTIDVPPGPAERELQLPVWNALYQVRDFSQYMNWIRAESGGKPLPLSQLNKSRWKISGADKGARIEYQMFSDNSGPYGAQLNAQHAFFNLAEILCYIGGERASPVEIEFRNIPPGWKLATPLVQRSSSDFSAINYDQLVDSPVEIAAFSEQDFDAACGKYRVIIDAPDSHPIFEKIIPPIEKIVSTEAGWMHDCPYQNYMFIYHFSDSPGGGGMEHSYSTAITLPKPDLDIRFDQFISVTAHEFFHLWNVKRIRPQSLEPVDYTKANYTPALWFSEGVDSTVAEYVLLRAGLLDEQRYLNHLGQEITELESRPAHLTQSAEQSSVDAWLEKYSYYNLPVRSISYYNKGELLGVLLDLKIREASGDQVSLEDLFQRMNSDYAKQGKFFQNSESVRQEAENLSHSDFREFFAQYVSGVTEIPWDSFFGTVGLRVTSSTVTFADSGFQATRVFNQPAVVVEVEPGSGADRAGLKPGDIIVEMNGQPAGRSFDRDIANLGPGVLLQLGVSRDGIRRDLQWNLGAAQQKVFRLQDLPDITAEQRARRKDWLFGSSRMHSPSKQ
jgi:predicted metalloprotease with PDZ domain